MHISGFLLILCKLNVFTLFGMLFLSSILVGGGPYLHTVFALEKECIKDINCNNNNHKNSTSLTVKKEIFGCEHIIRNDDFDYMNCTELDKDSNFWLPCTDAKINNTEFCKNLTKNLVDVEVLDKHKNQIQLFNDTSRRGTIKNIDPNRYIINQVKYVNSSNNQFEFRENDKVSQSCLNRGFADGGSLYNGKDPTLYKLCIQYDDENGNNCHKITINSNERKTCIVKNYISYAAW